MDGSLKKKKISKTVIQKNERLTIDIVQSGNSNSLVGFLNCLQNNIL